MWNFCYIWVLGLTPPIIRKSVPRKSLIPETPDTISSLWIIPSIRIWVVIWVVIWVIRRIRVHSLASSWRTRCRCWCGCRSGCCLCVQVCFAIMIDVISRFCGRCHTPLWTCKSYYKSISIYRFLMKYFHLEIKYVCILPCITATVKTRTSNIFFKNNIFLSAENDVYQVNCWIAYYITDTSAF